MTQTNKRSTFLKCPAKHSSRDYAIMMWIRCMLSSASSDGQPANSLDPPTVRKNRSISMPVYHLLYTEDIVVLIHVPLIK